MKIETITKVEETAKTLHVEADVRYWEDATVNDVEDNEGTLIPCREGDTWKPIIDIDSGKIINWEIGKKASIHYKVCDAGSYYVKNEFGRTLLEIDNDYVPKIMCPEDNGYGDYIIMEVSEDGTIANWKPSFKEFTPTP